MQLPRVVVLMATYDGHRFLREQLDSVLAQRGVDVRLMVSDDGSTDGTAALLQEYARDARITVLPTRRVGSSNANFLRLVRDVDASALGAGAVAFADQDDIWHHDKLSHQLELLRTHGVGAVSGDVIAFFGDRRVAIQKSQPQRSLDYVCESAGPGCTYLLTAETFRRVREVVRSKPDTDQAAAHDWLVYAIARAAGITWHIDDRPLVDYRQHGRNVIGANIGWNAARRRSTVLRSGAFRLDCAYIAEVAATVADPASSARLLALAADLRRWDRDARARVLRAIPELRRRRRDRLALAVATVLRRW